MSAKSVFCIVVLSFLIPHESQAYTLWGTGGIMWIYNWCTPTYLQGNWGGDNTTLETMATTQTFNKQHANSVSGWCGGFGSAQYSIDLASGYIGFWEQAQDSGKGELWGKIIDTLYFTVPAGTYSQGVSLPLTVSAGVSMSYPGYYYLNLSTVNLTLFDLSGHLMEGVYQWVSTTSGSNLHTLNTYLVGPGQVLNSPLQVALNISLAVAAVMNASGSIYPAHEVETLDALHSARITGFVTPNGITYDGSASGRFLTSAVPVPGTAALFMAGLMLMAAMRRAGNKTL